MDQDKAMFPCGAHLAALVRDDCVTGTLRLPLPFDGDDVLTLEWTRVEGFFISDEFAHKWGHHLKHTRDGAHYLGRFFYNGRPLQPAAELRSDHGPERFHENRFDLDGNDNPGLFLRFDGEEGFNVSSILGMLPHPQAHFELGADRLELVHRVEESGRELKMLWEPNGGAVWALGLRDELELEGGLVSALSYEDFIFDFFAHDMLWTYTYLPTDL